MVAQHYGTKDSTRKGRSKADIQQTTTNQAEAEIKTKPQNTITN